MTPAATRIPAGGSDPTTGTGGSNTTTARYDAPVALLSDDTPPARDRLIAAAKRQFADRGYEQTSTAMIARQAGTSESQLIRHFGGKRGLLMAIFDDAWGVVNRRIEKDVGSRGDPIVAIEAVLTSIIEVFHSDREMAYLFLFEGRRIRDASHRLELSRGYVAFVEFLQQQIRAAQKSGTVAPRLSTAAVASALIGAAEGMIRDELIAVMGGQPQPFSKAQVLKVFGRFLRSLAPDPR